MDKQLMLRHFETEYEDPIDEIVGDDPEFKKINDRFFRKIRGAL